MYTVKRVSRTEYTVIDENGKMNERFPTRPLAEKRAGFLNATADTPENRQARENRRKRASA